MDRIQTVAKFLVALVAAVAMTVTAWITQGEIVVQEWYLVIAGYISAALVWLVRNKPE